MGSSLKRQSAIRPIDHVMQRTKNKYTSKIPWGKSQTEQATALMVAIQALGDVETMKQSLEALGPEDDINTCRLYKKFTRSKEEEDAHNEAFPPLHVLVETEIRNSSDDIKPKVAEFAEALLQAGADPSVQGDYKSAPLFAVDAGAKETARAILNHLKRSQGKKVTGGTAMIGQTRQSLLYGGNGTDVFYMAAKSTDPEMLPLVYDILQDEVGEPNNSMDSKRAHGRLLEVASTYESLPNIVFLLEKGASPEGVHFDKALDWCDWPRPMHKACHRGHPDIVQALLDAGASLETRTVNGMGRVGGSIHFAIGTVSEDITQTERRMETIRILLKAGCDVNQPSVMERRTPLEFAISNGACDLIRFLIVECLCDTEKKNYESMARKHKKKSVARAYERSLQEREENGGESRSVRLRLEANESQDTAMVAFPLGGDRWSWDGEEDMIPEGVQFHPTLGLFNGEEQLQKLKELHGINTETIVSYEENDNDTANGSMSQLAMHVAKQLEETMKDEVLKSETENSWNAFWLLPTVGTNNQGDKDSKQPARKRPSRTRGRRNGHSPADVTANLLRDNLGVKIGERDSEPKSATVEVDELSNLPSILEVGRRCPAVKGFQKVLQSAGAEKVVVIVFNGNVVRPRLVGCIVGEEHPSFVGVYAHKVET